jgi:hypothetical protein
MAARKAATKPALECPNDSACALPERMECFSALRPDGEPVKVIRCIECGSQKTD